YELDVLGLGLLRVLNGQFRPAPWFAFQLLDRIFDGHTLEGSALGLCKWLSLIVRFLRDLMDQIARPDTDLGGGTVGYDRCNLDQVTGAVLGNLQAGVLDVFAA